MTSIVFAICTIGTVLSLLLILFFGRWTFVVLACAIAYNVWALVVSERQGFVRSNQIRRAFEPERHFNAAQVLAVVIFLMAQFGLGLYVLLAG